MCARAKWVGPTVSNSRAEKKVLLRSANKFQSYKETYTDMLLDELKHISMYKLRTYGLINGRNAQNGTFNESALLNI